MSNVIKLNGKSARVNVKISDESFAPLESENKDNSLELELHNRYVAGFNDGQKEAAAKLQIEYLEKLKAKYNQLDVLMNHLTEQAKNQTELFTQLVIETSFTIAEKIIQREIEKESNILNVIETCLKKVMTANSIIIKLNPDDFDFVLNDMKQLNRSIDSSKIKLEKEEMIQKGGCLVETEIGNADARISSQLNELKRKLEQSKDNDNDV
ncbi:Flagellar assembly protein FliH [Ignavibacterium album JCM 16511]|uniref:Flagellar assembly protein FliH n=1 Tax=Ignavibacterium album (strain DSM 19864 / JCM 16511 / NBRC 101810 / Mat9-16) TaxID=945713 RepID=I0AMN7_IGNAJ|nr:FliH/SctL family protein [Ignavibacterium album]AFH50244.1 Flagellar assembly protein FliH [Ignavibacterium album JCM 16511]